MCGIVVLAAAVVVLGGCGNGGDSQTTGSTAPAQSGTTSVDAFDSGSTTSVPDSEAATSAADDGSATAETTIPGGSEMTSGPTVLIKTSKGDITAELDPAAAPLTVENFLSYAQAGFYDGTIFHRVIPGFMIQGGGFTPDMQQKETEAPVKNEADNGLKNLRGTLAMARTNVVDSATSQFFINVADNAFLDHTAPTPQGYGYAVFGRVIDGLDVVDAIVSVPTTSVGPYQDVPETPVVIESVTVVEQ